MHKVRDHPFETSAIFESYPLPLAVFSYKSTIDRPLHMTKLSFTIFCRVNKLYSIIHKTPKWLTKVLPCVMVGESYFIHQQICQMFDPYRP